MSNTLLQKLNSIYNAIEVNKTPDLVTLAKVKDDIIYVIEAIQNQKTLSETTADFPQLLLQLEEIVRKNDTWKDFYVSSTGTTLLELIASIGAFLQNSIHIASLENFLDTSRRSSSVYAITKMLGVKIQRKTPARSKVWLKRKDSVESLIIPEFTPFTIDNIEFFNAKPIIFPLGQDLLPLNLTFDALGNPSYQQDLNSVVYTGDLVFENKGNVYFPTTGVVNVTYDNKNIQGTIEFTEDIMYPDSVFGTINFVGNTEIIPATAKFEILVSQYSGKVVNATLVPRNKSIYFRTPMNISFQLKKTGLSKSFITPCTGTANFPQNSIILTDEEYEIVKNKYVLPKYLDKEIARYENDIFLYNGRVAVTEHTVQFSSDFYSIYLNQPGFSVASDFIYLEVFDGTNITLWTQATKPLWEYNSDSTIFMDSTLPNGDVKITFGDGMYGKRVEAGWIVGIRYIITKGAQSNSGSTNLKVLCTKYNVYGGTLTPAYGGGDEKSSDHYKNVASTLFKTKTRAATLEDHEAILMQYSNVADVSVLSQKDIAPYDLRYMNRIGVCLLPHSPYLVKYPIESLMFGQMFDPTIVNTKDPFEPNAYKFSPLELQDFQQKFKQNSFSALDADFFLYPIPIAISIKVKISVFSQYSLELARSKVSDSIKELFVRKRGILGRSLYLVDIANACKIEEVDYSEIIYPINDVLLNESKDGKCSFICLSTKPDIIVEYSNRRG